MGTHIQRKKFDHLVLATEAAHGFVVLDPSVPGAKVTAEVKQVDGAFWVYVTQTGPLVTSEAPILPEYELVG
jgi:hypothetical protein